MTKEEAKGFTSPFNLKDAFVKKIPQGLKGRKSFLLTVKNFSVTQSNIEGLLDWLIDCWQKRQGRWRFHPIHERLP